MLKLADPPPPATEDELIEAVAQIVAAVAIKRLKASADTNEPATRDPNTEERAPE